LARAPSEAAGLLLTTCAAAAEEAQVEARLERFPAARAEDMEGFGVACACRLAAVPLRIVRGISNRVGDRDAEHWKLAPALASARLEALALLESVWDEGGNER
jgi:futalosine hydrolase